MVACDDGACGTNSVVTWNAEAGVPYYAFADGANGAKGAYTLSIFFH